MCLLSFVVGGYFRSRKSFSVIREIFQSLARFSWDGQIFQSAVRFFGTYFDVGVGNKIHLAGFGLDFSESGMIFLKLAEIFSEIFLSRFSSDQIFSDIRETVRNLIKFLWSLADALLSG